MSATSGDPLSSIATDRISPHFGHDVADLDEGRWRCLTCQPIADAFDQGWFDAAKGGAAETPREVGRRYPDYTAAQVEEYLNGVDDGVTGDRFRLDWNARHGA